MKRVLGTAKRLATACVVGMGLAHGQAVIVYDNSENDLLSRFEPTVEVGDEIVLSQLNLTDRVFTLFSFEYYATNEVFGTTALSNSVYATVRFYLNDGPTFNGYPTPGTAIWTSTPALLSPTERATVIWSVAGGDFTYGSVILPLSNMTWSVTFSNAHSTDHVGVDLYSPPVVGQNVDDYWEKGGSGWELKTNTVPMDFAAIIEAVPEPATVWLLGLGGLFGLGLLRRWRQRA